jgi:hypothetical protein
MRQITLEMPDDVADGLESHSEPSLPRSLLEMIAIEGYRSGKLTHAQVRRLLGFEHRFDVDAFLKERGVPHSYTIAELDKDRETFRKLGI